MSRDRVTTQDWARPTARTAETTYAVVCLFLWLALPLPPGSDWPTSLYLGGTALAAAVLAWLLRRPTSTVWYGAVVLSALVIVTQLLRLPAIVDFAHRELTTPAIVYATDGVTVFEGSKVAAFIMVLGSLPLLLQLTVALCCYRLRHLRRPTSYVAGTAR
jgi:hypothetical protein